MRKKVIAVLVIALTLFIATAVFAHPAKSLSAQWNASNHTLTVTAEHNVNDPAKHFILSLSISEGNKLLFQQQYTSQASPEQFRDNVVLAGLTSGAKLRIQVACNIMGTMETEFTIP